MDNTSSHGQWDLNLASKWGQLPWRIIQTQGDLNLACKGGSRNLHNTFRATLQNQV